jgi:hypothetical protein
MASPNGTFDYARHWLRPCEGELGFIGSGSEIHESVPESSRLLTKTDDAKRFVEDMKIDRSGSRAQEHDILISDPMDRSIGQVKGSLFP